MKNFMKNIMYFLITMLIMSFAVGGGSTKNSTSKQKQQLELKRAVEKDMMNAPLTRSEERRLKSYRKWEKEHRANEYNKKYY